MYGTNLVSKKFWLWPKKTAKATLSPSQKHYLKHKEEARICIVSRVEYFANLYGFDYKRIAIKNQRRAWGSCSAKGNLNFSYKLLFLPECLRDYIVVHELCHLRELNHKAAFWQEVFTIMPDYEVRLKLLRQHERTKGTSQPALLDLRTQHTECVSCAQSRMKESFVCDVL